MRVIFYHGLESTPNGSKPHALREVFPDIEVPDFTGMAYEDRVSKAEALLVEGEPAYIIGSSLGGLLAAHMAHKHPNHIAGLLLLAPAMLMDKAGIHTTPTNTVMMLGLHDEIEDLNEEAAEFATYTGTPIVWVEDSHRLSHHLPMICEMAQAGYMATLA